MPSFRNDRKRRQDNLRPVNTREQLIRILIVCEGEKTEPNYFLSFNLRANVSVEIIKQAGNTVSLIKKAEEVVRELGYRIAPINETVSAVSTDTTDDDSPLVDEPRDVVWCVFDRDSFPAGHFNTAIQMAKSKSFNCAYSNEAFELWYLLHYNYHISHTSRDDYKSMLSLRLGKTYRKNDPNLYSTLLPLQSIAIRNAENLLREYQPHHIPENNNPCTTVHELVIFLNKFLRT